MLVPRYMLVPRDAARSMHNVMRFLHCHVCGVALVLLGHTPHALCALAGFFVWVCALGVIRLPSANRVVLAALMERVLHKRERVCVGVWHGLFCVVCVVFFVCVFRLSFPLCFPL